MKELISMRKLWRRLLIFCALLIVLELILRSIGFGQLAVYQESEDYEYAFVPSQNVHRFGKQFFINSSGMRSDELEKDEFRILKFGDSVLNGGAATDQSELASDILNEELKNQRANARVLQVSAGSWGPDNAFAWMKIHGDFDAEAIVLVFSSHDWQDQMTFEKVVGVLDFYPDEEPSFAISDAVIWTYSRYFQKIDWNALQATAPIIQQAKFNSGWLSFITYCAERDIPLLVYHHASLSEQENQTWNPNGIALETFLLFHDVKTISGLKGGFSDEDFRDEIHLDASGQRKLADQILPYLEVIVAAK